MGYKEGAPWAGSPRWECEDCPVDSLDEDVMKTHVRKYHQPDVIAEVKDDSEEVEMVELREEVEE